MNYKSLADMPYYKECAPLVEGLGYRLVSLKIESNGRVMAVAASPVGEAMGVDECAKVHRALLSRLEALLQRDDLAMELSSPGIERNIKNAAEFALFAGYSVRLFVRRGEEEGGEWMLGKIHSADEAAVTIEDTEDGMRVLYSDIVKAKLTDEMASRSPSTPMSGSSSAAAVTAVAAVYRDDRLKGGNQ